MKNQLHKNLCDKANKLHDWYCEQTHNRQYPIYSSFDIRDSGFKIANVDANIYPAGFNNICSADREHSIEILKEHLDSQYGTQLKRILLVTEEHTLNAHYWENVLAIQYLLEKAERQVLLAIPRRLEKPLHAKSATGREVMVHSAYFDTEIIKSFSPQLIVSNNDFSEPYEEWGKSVPVSINPPRELGWYQRKKSRYFKHYNDIATQFAQLADLDPFYLTVKTELFSHFDLTDDQSLKSLAEKVDEMISSLQQSYSQRGIKESPYVFVKNNAGTYGLAVVSAQSGQEILEWSYRSRKKMKAAKSGRKVEEVIIQEGIPTRVQHDGATAEPVIYMIARELAGGFLRSHTEKSNTESLNSPGAVFQRLCVSDLEINVQNSPLENIYGWSARLGVLAIGREAAEMGVLFR